MQNEQPKNPEQPDDGKKKGRGRGRPRKSEEHKRKTRAEYFRKYRQKIKEDPEHYAKVQEQRRERMRRYLASDAGKLHLERVKNNPKVKKKNREIQRKLRENPEHKEWFKNYFKNWLKDPVNYFSHRCRLAVREQLKKTGTWQQAKENGKNFDHILTARSLGLFFQTKDLLHKEDKKMYQLIISISNSSFNLRQLKKENNHRGNNASADKQTEIAKLMEEKNPLICSGLEAFIKELYKGDEK